MHAVGLPLAGLLPTARLALLLPPPPTPCPPATDFDPTNTTLFIGGLSGGVSEEQLRASFARFGDIIYVKIPAVGGVGGWRVGWGGWVLACVCTWRAELAELAC